MTVIRLNRIEFIYDFFTTGGNKFHRILGIIVDAENSFGTVQHRRIVFLPVIRPARSHRTDNAALRPVYADRVVVDADHIVVRIFFIERCKARRRFDDRIAEQKLYQIGFVNSQISHRAHGRFFAVKKPYVLSGIDAPRFRSSVSENRSKRNDFSERSVFDEFSRFDVRFCKPLILSDHQKSIVCFRFRHHAFAFFERYRHGFFTEYVLSRSERFDRDLGMRVIRRTHAHRIDRRIGKHIFARFIGFAGVLFRKRFRALFVYIRNTDYLCIAVAEIFGQVPHLRDFSAADNSDMYHTVSCDSICNVPAHAAAPATASKN